MKDIDYTKAIEIYRSLYEQAKAFEREFDERIEAEYGEGTAQFFSNPFIAVKDMMQVYVEKPSNGAAYCFDNENSGAKFYRLMQGSFEVCEVVRKPIITESEGENT